MAFFWPRLGALARGRNWMSPNDFISDRYNSKTLRLLSTWCGCVQLLLLTAIEWMALTTMLEVLVEGDMKPAAAVWLLATIVFICEMVRQLQQMNDAAMSAHMLPTPTLNDDGSPAAAVLDTTAFPAATGR